MGPIQTVLVYLRNSQSTTKLPIILAMCLAGRSLRWYNQLTDKAQSKPNAEHRKNGGY